MSLLIKKVREGAKLPARATEGSAGLDIFACIEEPVLIFAGESVVIPTGIAMEIPKGSVGLVFGRSGLGIRHGLVPPTPWGVTIRISAERSCRAQEPGRRLYNISGR